MTQSKIVGIDLGTTNSCVAIMEGGRPVVIENSEGFRTTPSVVAFTKSGDRLVGQVAKRQAITNPERTIQSIKREMGSNYRVGIDTTEYTPEQISSMILHKLRVDAEAYLGEEVIKAVITVPAYFNDSQRQATKDAGKIAGLEVLRVINEPTASALAYGLNKMKDKSTILVYDLGGGTFDVSILEINDGVFEVKSTSGNNRLGGDDFDQCLIDWMNSEFIKQHSIDLSKDRMAMQRLKEASEKAKIELSTTLHTDVNLPFLAGDTTGPKHLQTNLTRTQFNALTAHLVEETFGPIQTALDDADITPEQLDQIILVGGSTRIPAVQDAIKRFFGREPAKSVNPDEAAALGAAIQGSIISGEGPDVLLLDVISLSLGIETAGGLFTKIIERNTTIPTSRSMMFTTSEDGQTSVEVHVLQGERELSKYNKSLARFHLIGIPRAPRGVPQIEVTFEIDADGIVQCSAKDAASGISQTVTIERSSNLDPEEVSRLQVEALEFAIQDHSLKEQIKAKIQAETLISEASRTLERYGDKMEKSTIEKVQQFLERVQEELVKEIQSDDLKPAVKELDGALLELGRAIYAINRKANQAERESQTHHATNANRQEEYDLTNVDENEQIPLKKEGSKETI